MTCLGHPYLVCSPRKPKDASEFVVRPERIPGPE